eukprot:7688360-Alexandrium_andersonii.AAC.1
MCIRDSLETTEADDEPFAFGSPAQGLNSSANPAPKQQPARPRSTQGPDGSAGRAPLQPTAKPGQPRKQRQQQQQQRP